MRYLVSDVLSDLEEKMVFVAGPRQVGKTTLSQAIVEHFGSGAVYLNWDADKDRKRIRAQDWSATAPLVVLDEIHKYNRWKTWLKGVYDTRPSGQKYLITGSARLDVYRRGGDSMLGRYHLWHLHPFSLGEQPLDLPAQQVLERLLRHGGFPEPYLRGDDRFTRRWRTERLTRVIRDDLRDLERVDALSQLEQLLDMLRTRVGAPVVAANIARDLEVAPKTVVRYCDLFERMFLCFAVKPYVGKLTRAIRKPPKIYFYDNGDVDGDEGARFENLVATHLWKRIQYLQEHDGYRYELRYVRDKEGREVDFVILRERKVVECWEAKWADTTLSSSLRYFKERLSPTRAVQVVAAGGVQKLEHGCEIVSAATALRFCP